MPLSRRNTWDWRGANTLHHNMPIGSDDHVFDDTGMGGNRGDFASSLGTLLETKLIKEEQSLGREIK